MKRNLAIALGALVLLVLVGVVLLREDKDRPSSSTPPPSQQGPSGRHPAGGSPPSPGAPPAAHSNSGSKSPPGSFAGITVRGVVREVRGAPVKGARVRLLDEGAESTTGQDGVFTLALPPGVAPGKRLILLAEGPPPLAPRVVPGVLPGSQRVIIVLRPSETFVTGRVVRLPEKTPVPNAKVEASSGEWLGRATTDSAGRFRLEGAPPGALGLVASAEGLVPRVVTVNVPRGGSGPDHEIALEKGSRFAGRVTRAGKTLAGATVILHQGGVPLSFERRTTRTDAAGGFAFEALPPGEGRVQARAEDGVSPELPVRSDGFRDVDPVTLEIQAGATIAGKVVCAGTPVPGAEVEVADSDGSKQRATSDASGRFRIEPLTPSSGGAPVLFSLKARAAGYAPVRLDTLAGNDLTVTLEKAATLVVAVGPPAMGIEVEAEGLERERKLLRERSRDAKRVELVADDLPGGPIYFTASAPGRASVSRKVEVASGATERVEVDLAAGATIEGRCVGDDGGPVAGASVVAQDPASGPLGSAAEATSGPDGNFAIADVGPGPRRIFASAPGYLDAQVEGAAGTPVTVTLARSHSLEVRVTMAEHPLRPADDDGHGHHSHAQTGRVLVRVVPATGDPEIRTTFADRGSASVLFDRLRGGKVRVEVFSPGYAPAAREVDPALAPAAEVSLAAGARAKGLVLGSDGKPLPGAAISRGRDPDEDLQSESSFATLLAMTEDEGDFDVAIAPDGEDVVVTHPEHAPLLTRLAPGSAIKIQLVPGSVLSGRTLGKDGAAVGGIGVSISGPLNKRTTSASDGTFTVPGLLPGRYQVRRADAPEGTGVDVSVGNRGEVSVDLKAP